MVVASAAGVLGVILLLFGLGAIGFGVRALVRRGSRAGARAGRRGFDFLRYAPGRSRMSPEEKDHDTALRAANKNLARAQKDHQRAVRDAEKQVTAARHPKPIGKYGQTVLTPTWISGPGGGGRLTPDVRATVDTAGNLAVTKRVTLTRLAAGGIVGGLLFQKKQKHDTRELYLMVEGPDFDILQTCQPDHGPLVRLLAQKINTAAKTSAASAQQHAQAIKQAEAHLARITADHSSITAARDHLAALESGRPRELPQSTGGSSIPAE